MCGVDFTADIKCGKRGRGREGVGRHIQTLLRIGERDREKGGKSCLAYGGGAAGQTTISRSLSILPSPTKERKLGHGGENTPQRRGRMHVQ